MTGEANGMGNLPERLAPFPTCSAIIRMRFNGRMLFLYSPIGLKTYPAASGKRGPDFGLEAQHDRGLGVIPVGDYWIDPEQMWTASPLVEVLRNVPLLREYPEGWGHHRITIHEMPGTQTYGRGGFFIHGGTHPGSAGCVHVIGASGMETFLADLKTALGGLPHCSVLLTVDYSQ